MPLEDRELSRDPSIRAALDASGPDGDALRLALIEALGTHPTRQATAASPSIAARNVSQFWSASDSTTTAPALPASNVPTPTSRAARRTAWKNASCSAVASMQPTATTRWGRSRS